MRNKKKRPFSPPISRAQYNKESSVLKIISIGILSLLLTACATTAPVLNTNSPLHIYGVSSLSPKNGSWSVLLGQVTKLLLKQD